MYQLTRTSAIRRTTDGASIPADSRNIDYQAYLAWVTAGNTPIPRDAQEVSDEAAHDAKMAQEAADVAAARTHTKLKALAAMTPAQVQTWVAANVTNLAQAQDAIATLAIAVSVLARRL